ncbi:MAG: hypothetical protein ACTSWD_15460 [Candidatus Heimdallarchaeota archaeon]
MSQSEIKEAEIVKFPGIASISLSITPINEFESFDLLEAIVRVYDDNNEQIMRQKSRSLHTIAKNLKLFIQTRTNLPINDRRMSTWFADYLSGMSIKLDEEESYQIIKKASQALERVSRVKIELVEPSDLVSIETDVLPKLIELKSDHLMSEDELFEMLKTHQTPVSNFVHRVISYVNSGGVEHKDKITLEITQTEKILEHTLIGSFKNETEKVLTNVVLADVVPYCYCIKDVVCKEGGKYKKELLDNGLKLQWKVKQLAPGDEIKVLYTFEKRIPRTIYVRKEDDIRIVQDYNSILLDEVDGKVINYFISEVINLLPVTLDELIVRDLIPTELHIAEASVTEDMKFVDFGQLYGTNVQITLMNVETGTKYMNNFQVDPSPLIWKYDFNLDIPDSKDKVKVTKIIEQIRSIDAIICTIAVSSSVPCQIICEMESGLKAEEFLPPTAAPQAKGNSLTWDVSEQLAVSVALSGTLNRQPIPPKVKVNNVEYPMPEAANGFVRRSKVISMPFNHVALYRKTEREY